jgi:hypothetical protein
MKKFILSFVLFVPVCCFAQFNETFSDGNFTNNPVWSGTSSNFTVNSSSQLQSKAAASSTSYLFTSSEAFDDATWECWVKITYNPSSQNYASIYIVADRNDISAGCYGYYVQIGGTNDEVSLFVQEGTKKTKIIDGIDKRTDKNPVELRIRVTRDSQGNFELFSKLPAETDYISEGKTLNNVIKQSQYFGLLFVNSNSTGSDYYFDDIVVTGNKALDLEPPVWNSFTLEQPDKLNLGFSEAMDFSNAAFILDQGMGNPVSQSISSDKKSVSLTFATDFEKGKIYRLVIDGLTDLAGNALTETERSIGITEKIEAGDLIFNEVMFDNPENSVEYLEIQNKSDKLLDVSGLIFTTRKADGSLNTGNRIPAETSLLPKGYLALCSDAEVVRSYHGCPPGSNILTTDWTALNNESSTLVLTNAAKDTIYDELTYNVKWHHILIKNPKGVALERINPDMPTQDANSWHSAGSEVNYGTPGYKNSQYRDILSEENSEKFVWADPECFSPDNDGVNDVCFIRYKTEMNGYVANAVILNSVGVKVFQLASDILLSSEGFFSWDGRNDNGKIANAGIYVLCFEIFNPKIGARKRIKLPIVVSSR